MLPKIKLPAWPSKGTKTQKLQKLENYRECARIARVHGKTAEFAQHWDAIVQEAERVLCIAGVATKELQEEYARREFAEAYSYK